MKVCSCGSCLVRVISPVTGVALMREPAAPAIVGLPADGKIIRKPRASCSTIRSLCCPAWRACRLPIMLTLRTARVAPKVREASSSPIYALACDASKVVTGNAHLRNQSGSLIRQRAGRRPSNTIPLGLFRSGDPAAAGSRPEQFRSIVALIQSRLPLRLEGRKIGLCYHAGLARLGIVTDILRRLDTLTGVVQGLDRRRAHTVRVRGACRHLLASLD